MLCDHRGKPRGRREYVGEGEQRAQAAWRLLREEYEAEDRNEEFNRPLGRYWINRA